MTKQERLFQAIGEADPELVARSDRIPVAKASPRTHWVKTAAACLAVLLVTAALLRNLPFGSSSSSSTTAGGTASPSAGNTTEASAGTAASSAGTEAGSAPVSPSAGGGEVILPFSTVGEFHLVRLDPENEVQASAPEFMIYVNQEMYTVSEENGVFTVAPEQAPSEELPACRMTIAHRADVSPEQAAEDIAAELAQTYASVSDIKSDQGVKGLYLSASDGAAWNDAQAEVWLVDDRQGGAFTLTSAYFLEAAEGHGMRFRDMIATFQVVTEAIPDWLTELRNTAEAVSRAVFADDLSQAAELLAENAQVYGLGQDMLADVSVSSIDCMVDDPRLPETAVVSIRFGFLEDSYDYLTLELVRREGRWLVTWGGVEK